MHGTAKLGIKSEKNLYRNESEQNYYIVWEICKDNLYRLSLFGH